MTNRILEIVIRPCHLLKPNTRTSLTPKKNHLVHCNKFFESLQATFMRILRELTLFTNLIDSYFPNRVFPQGYAVLY